MWHAAAMLSYLILSLLLFWRVLPAFATAVGTVGRGDANDAWQNVWMLWWVHRAVTAGQNPFFTRLLFYPDGVNLFWQTLNSPNGLLALPLTATWGPIASYNALAIASFVTSAGTMYWAAFRIVRSYGAAWIAGIFFSFSPFHLSKLYDGQLELMSMQYLPLFVLWLVYAFAERRWLFAGLAGGLLVVITLTSLYYGMFSLIFGGLYGLSQLLHKRQPKAWLGLAGRGVLVVAPLAVVLIPPLLSREGQGTLQDWQVKQTLHSATPLDWFLPSPYNPLWGSKVAAIQEASHGLAAANNISLGWLVLALALIGVLNQRRHVLGWVAIVGALSIFELGPHLVLWGKATSISLPFALLDYLPGIKLGQRPNHLVAYTSIVLALLAAYGWAAAERWTGQRRWWLVPVVGLLAFDLWPVSLQTASLHLAPFWYNIAQSDGGAILELPFEKKGSGPMEAQMIHQRPIMGGYLARVPPNRVAETTDGLRQLWSPAQARGSIVAPDWSMAVVPALAAYDVRYVVLHKDLLLPDDLATIRTGLSHATQVFEDTSIVAYERPSTSARRPVLALEEGWSQLEAAGQKHWQWSSPEATFHVFNPAAAASLIRLTWQVQTGGDAKSATLLVERRGRWERLCSIDVVREIRHGQVVLEVPPGTTRFKLVSAATTAPAGETRQLALRFSAFQIDDLKP
ncbi:MAG: hypothetical protein NVS2B7_25510 [Herpetosiphon sp.]